MYGCNLRRLIVWFELKQNSMQKIKKTSLERKLREAILIKCRECKIYKLNNISELHYSWREQ